MKYVLIALLLMAAVSPIYSQDSVLESQKKYKEAFHLSQKHTHRPTFENTNEKPLVTSKELVCSKESSTLSCFIKKAELRLIKYYKVFVVWIKSFFKFDINLKVPSIKKSPLTNLPPSIGTLSANKFGSGSYPAVDFTASSFSDPDGTVAKVRWIFGDGTTIELLPGEFNSNAFVKHVYKTLAYFPVQFQVEDDLGAVTTKTIYVETFENTQPAVTFTATPDLIDPLKVQIDISGSDIDGNSINLRTMGCPSVPNTGAATFLCVFPSAGDYPISITVHDQNKAFIVAETTLTVGGSEVKSDPVAIYDSNTIYGNAPLTINFNGEFSFDLDGEIVSYEWSFSDGNKPGNIAIGKTVSHTFTQPGTYGVRLKVKDDEGNVSEKYGEIYVEGNSQVPHISIYNTGPLKISMDTENVSFPIPVHFEMMFWDFGDGNKGIGRWVEHTYAAPGTYTVGLKYVDLFGVTYNQSKVITIENTNNSPIASYLPNFYKTLVGDDVIYDASTSSDPQDSDPLTYRWVFYDGEQFEDTDPEVIKNYDLQGLKLTNLFVTNSRGFSARTIGLSEVSTEFRAITPRITFNPKIGTGTFAANFDGSKTVSEVGNIITHEWVIDGITTAGSSANHTFNTAGDHFFQYFVTDSLGNQATVTDKVISLATSAPGGNANPYADITTQVDPNNNRIIDYHCFNSTDSDDYVAYCEWKLNGVSLSDMKSGTLNLEENIQYTLELKVIDNWGASTTVQRSFDFRVQPVAVIDYDYYPLRPIIGNAITFGAEEASVPGRTIIQYHWNFGDSTTAMGQSQSHTYYTAGTYTVTLTLTDDLAATYVKTKSITVNSSGTTSGFEIIARPADLSGRARTSQAYRAFFAPETIRFEAQGLATSEGIMKDIVWNFGNSEYGYGENVEYTYFTPGTYTVSVTGKTPSNSAVSASMTVIVNDRGCTEKHTNTMCLKVTGAGNNILSLGNSSWTLAHSLGAVNYSTSSSDYPNGWIYIEAQDGSEEKHYLDDAVTVSGAQLILSREKILDKNINLDRPYRIYVKTMSTAAAYMVGETFDFYFGGSRLDIQLSETGTKLEVVNTGNMWRKYYDLSSVDEKILTNIPSGNYVIVATKGIKKAIRKIKLGAEENKIIEIDIDQELLLSKKKRLSAKKQKMSDENPPSWSLGLCGEHSPFDMAPKRNLSSVEFAAKKFSSTAPDAQASFTQLGRHTPRPTVLSCGVTTPAILYGQNKWKFKEGPGRCNDDYKAHPYWKEYLNTLGREDEAIVIAYEIKDKWAPEVVKGHFVTSARDIMLKNNLKIEDLSAKVGIGKYLEDNGGDFAQRVQYLLPIPVQFRRPEIKFQLISDHNTSAENYYNVECDIVDNISPVYVSDLGVYSLNNSTFQVMDTNARVSLQKQYGFFPAQYDDRSSSAVAYASEAGKARYTVKIQTHESSGITWQGAEVVFIYGEESFTKFYPFLGVFANSPFERSYTDNIIIDTADIENKFQWQPGEKKLTLKVSPVGKISVDYDFKGEAKNFPFTALFDLQTVKADYPMLCGGGFNYNASSQLTTFVRDDLLSSLMVAASDLSASLKCGEASPPFGGPFDITSTWRYRALKSGNEIFMRSINNNGDHETYDDFQNVSPTRMADVDAYMDFSDDAKTISLIATEYDGMSNPTDKKLLYDFCHPTGSPAVEPCKAETVFTDLDHNMVLKICQWNMTAGVMPAGCPLVDANKIVRFSAWVEKNATTFNEWTKRYPLQAFIGSGKARPLSSAPLALNWQKEALMKGLWPDGKPIWRAAEGLETLMPSRSAECHNNVGGCESLKSFFIDDEKYFRSVSVMNGWK